MISSRNHEEILAAATGNNGRSRAYTDTRRASLDNRNTVRQNRERRATLNWAGGPNGILQLFEEMLRETYERDLAREVELNRLLQQQRPNSGRNQDHRSSSSLIDSSTVQQSTSSGNSASSSHFRQPRQQLNIPEVVAIPRRIPAVTVNTDSVKIPEFGTSFRIVSYSRSGRRDYVPMALSRDPKLCFALFAEDDVNFAIECDNSSSTTRHVYFDLKMHNLAKSYSAFSAETGSLKAYQSGEKFHFIRQSRQDVESYVGRYATNQGITYDQASADVSRINFKVRYSVPGYGIVVKPMGGEVFTLNIHGTDTVAAIKYRIESVKDISMDLQKLYFLGKQLENRRTAAKSKIIRGATIHLVQVVRGGRIPEAGAAAPNGIITSGSETELASQEGSLERGERGAILRGEHIQIGNKFYPCPWPATDNSVEIQDFTIELRLAPKFRVF